MSKDALKFLQSYVRELVDVGGENLPKSISIKLGQKLGQLYKSKGITSYEKGLMGMYKVMNGKPTVTQIDDNNYEVTVKYKNNFCPVGGTLNCEIAELFQNSICIPYTQGFLTSLNPLFKYGGKVQKCIINDNNKFCQYTLHLEEKEK